MEASAYEPVRKHWTTEGELVSSRKSLLAIGGMRAGTRLRQGVEPNAQLNNDLNPCRDWCGFSLVLGGTPRFRSNFTDKVPFFADLSVSKTYFTDKPSFFGDLSVNFWPL